MRIAVICLDPLIRGALESLLREQPDFQVVGSGCCCGSAEAIAETLHPDVLIVTEECVDEEGSEMVRQLRGAFGLKAMLVIEGRRACRDVAGAFDAIQSGQTGVGSFLWRIRELTGVRPARDVEESGSPRPRAPGGATAFTARTAREADVARLLVQGMSNRRISARLGISELTVKIYMTRLFRSTGCENRTQLAAKLAMAGTVAGPSGGY
jgi:DNA-binding NarL/FixJ family response regulator